MRSTSLNAFISLLFLQSLSIHLGFLSVSCFDLVKDYSGSSFFDEWDFYGSWDNLTLGSLYSFFLFPSLIISSNMACIMPSGIQVM